MPDDPFSLTELARLADVTPRTVRYYLAQGLLPSPEASGPATRYGEAHLNRLRLIRRLQREHLPLAEIRGRLERLGDDGIALALAGPVATPAPAADPDATLAYVHSIMARAGVAPRIYPRRDAAPSLTTRVAEVRGEAPEASFGRPVPDEFPLRDAPEPAAPSPPAPASAPPPGILVPPPTPGRPPDRSTWERLAITPDVELHVRRPLDRATNRLVERLIRIARELFEDDD